MFRWISLISFVAVLGGIVLHHLVFPYRYKSQHTPASLPVRSVHLLRLLFLKWNRAWPVRLRKLAFLLGLLSFCVLLVTGFGPLLLGGRLHGYLVMIHATFAPVFIACTAFIAVTAAADYAFNKNDIKQLPRPWRKLPKRAEGCWFTDSGVGAKTGFWVLLVLSLPLTLTVVVSMLPLYGPKWQDFMFAVHRYCSLIFALIAMIELYILARMQSLEDIHDCRD